MSDFEKLDVLWGAKEIARYIGRSPRAAFHMLENGQIPGRKTGKLWMATKRELAAALSSDAAAASTGGH
jgi:hypothetical protein